MTKKARQKPQASRPIDRWSAVGSGYRRHMPQDTEWLAGWLTRRGFEAQPHEAQEVATALSREDWQAMRNAWRQKEYRSRGDEDTDAALNSARKLGGLWEHLIRLNVVSRDDARLLAMAHTEFVEENNFPGGGFSDQGARNVVGAILGREARKERRKLGISVGELTAEDRAAIDDWLARRVEPKDTTDAIAKIKETLIEQLRADRQ